MERRCCSSAHRRSRHARTSRCAEIYLWRLHLNVVRLNDTRVAARIWGKDTRGDGNMSPGSAPTIAYIFGLSCEAMYGFRRVLCPHRRPVCASFPKAWVNNEVASTQTSYGTAFPQSEAASLVLSHSPGSSTAPIRRHLSPVMHRLLMHRPSSVAGDRFAVGTDIVEDIGIWMVNGRHRVRRFWENGGDNR